MCANDCDVAFLRIGIGAWNVLLHRQRQFRFLLVVDGKGILSDMLAWNGVGDDVENRVSHLGPGSMYVVRGRLWLFLFDENALDNMLQLLNTNTGVFLRPCREMGTSATSSFCQW